MKRINFFSELLFVIAVFFSAKITIAKTYTGLDAQKILNEATRIDIEDKQNTIKFVVLNDNAEISKNDAQQWLQNFMKKQEPLSEFKFKKSSRDNDGFEKDEFEQWVNGYQVQHSIIKLHFKNGKLASFNAQYQKINAITSKVISTSVSQAEQNIVNIFLKKGFTKKEIIPTFIQTVYMLNKNNTLELCHKFDVNSTAKKPMRIYAYISVTDGKFVSEENRIHYTNVTATAHTSYCGTVPIKTDSLNSTTYYLRELGAKSILTKNMNNSTDYLSATEFTNTSKIWYTSTNSNTVALDAHYGAEKTYDYYLLNYGLNSYDGAGSAINSYVHYDFGFVNAFWDGTQMTYGDGDGSSYGPLTSTDVVGHEITHAVTENSAGLIYSSESGALNESFSDIFGVVIDYYANPTTANFLMGDQFSFSGEPFRNLANPDATSNPDTYQGNNWDFSEEVHQNSTVQTYWFYLLCNGGIGVNDIGNSYAVNSITMSHAARIAYRTLTTYLTANATYADARTYSIQSAIDLYGNCSDEVVQVTNAWYAVGVGSIFSNSVVASFSSPSHVKCSIPATINFTNSSMNASTYTWSFGDGGTSTLQNPTHTYTTYGNYNVRLIANGTVACASHDTIILSNYVQVLNLPQPVAASCAPTSSTFCCNHGIGNVTLGSINSTTGNGSEGGYNDFTCGNNTPLVAGNPYPISITTLSTDAQYVSVYVDYNNNGVFSTTELAYSTSIATAGLHSGYIFTPATAVLNTPLRIRVLSSGSTISGPCISLNNGQAEDYAVTFSHASGAPVADFLLSSTTINLGNTLSLTDLSTNVPTSWSWTINGGTPSTSTLQNPTSVFNSTGVYNITLTASNSFGSSSVTKVVTVVNTFTLCNPTSSQICTSTSGLLYDSGGPLGSYNNGEYCTFTISPPCADTIKFSFSSFSTESGYDYFSIYDGTNNTGTLLLNTSGSFIPPDVFATSGSMYIEFYSDGSVTSSGFSTSWTTVQYSSAAPVAAFSSSPSNVPLMDTVHFTNSSSASATSWLWNFGDGATSTLQNPTHAYSSSGTFTVTLTAYSCQASNTITHTVTVQAAPSIIFNPTSFTVNLGCNDTTTLNLNIHNNGPGTLNWQSSNTSSTTSNHNLLVWCYGSDFSTGGEYQNTLTALNQYYSNYTLDSTRTSSPALLQSKLVGKKVLLITENETGLSTVAASCASVIQAFVQNGGSVISCGDSYTAQNIGVFTSSVSTVYSGVLSVVNSTSPISANVQTSFNYSNATIYKQFTDANKVEIVSDISGNDVVTYRPYGSGRAIYVGFDFYAFDNNAAYLLANSVEWCMNSSGIADPNVVVSPTSGTAAAGANNAVTIEVNSSGLSGGAHTVYAHFTTNDPLHLNDSIAIHLNISTLPCVHFGYNISNNCSGVVAFTDSTTNSPTSWFWRFGDGTTSTIQNPSHTYSAAGTYTVRLRATNTSGTDSSLRVITLANVGGPVSANCTPTQALSSSYGITHVVFGTINNSSSSSAEGYKDFTCTNSTIVNPGTQYLLSVSTVYNAEKVYAWIDYNNDGVFSTAEQVAYNTVVDTLHQNTILIPNTGVVSNTSLRMRLISTYYTLTDACSSISYGQCEDYTIKIMSATAAPVANFSFIPNPVNIGTSVQFSDLSSNSPTSWSWTINGGTPSSSTSQNPTSIFNTLGTYNVTLTATNSYGSNSITKPVTVVSSINLCNPTSSQTTTAVSGMLYDSGGPTGSYNNGENCTLTISPACADTIKFTVSSLSLESCCDYLRVYDGTSNAGTLIFSSGSNSVPSTVNAFSGNIYVQFTTDGSVTSSGFSTSWTTVQYSSAAPVAAFSSSPSNVPLMDTVHFTNSSSASATSWLWNFGDGATSTLQNPTHAYSSSGTFTVTLTAYSCQASNTITHTVTVQAAPSIIFNPTSFTVNLGCNDTTTLNLNIHNNGPGTLNWQSSNTSSTTSNHNLLVWCYGSDFSTGGEYQNTLTALNQYYSNYTLDSTRTSSPALLQSKLVGKKVLLITENETGLSTVAASCASVIQAFVQNGGSVISCGDSYTAQNIGVFTSSVSTVYSGVLSVVNSTSPISANVQTSFNYSNATIYKQFTDANKVEIVSDISGNDVVTYRPYGSGRAIYVGFDFYAFDNNAAYLLANSVEWCMNSSGIADPNVVVSPTSGTAAAGANNAVTIEVNSSGLSGGAHTVYAHFTTNDPLHLNDSIAIHLNISTLPCVHFGYNISNNCSGVVAFTDSTTNSPTSWFWRFGDGTTSTIQNPSHTYSAAGTYTVRLRATNTSGTDSSLRVITLANVGGPVSANCTPTQALSSSYGITHVVFGTINNSSSSSAEGYKDFTCTNSTIVNPGTQYLLSVSTIYNAEKVYAWIDYNNDGIFSTTEQVAYNTVVDTLHQMNIIIPTSGAVQNSHLRMRIISTYYTLSTACSAISYGQCEDYTIQIQATSAPIAQFIANPLVVWINQPVQFTDQSTNSPTSWHWNLQGSSNVNAVVQNPQVSYTTAGTYTCTLTATNAGGSDTISHASYIQVNNLPAVNFTNSVNSCNGQVSFSAFLPTPYTTCTWNFGDGTILTNSTQNITHTYTTTGNYMVLFTATSQYGVNTFSSLINIQFWNPTITLSGLLIAGGNIDFNVNSTDSISTYVWDFGDSQTSTNAIPTHVYATQGVYYIAALVTSTSGCVQTILDTLNIIYVSVDDSKANSFSVYPNPFNDFVTIKSSVVDLNQIKIQNIKFMDVVGRELSAIEFAASTVQNGEMILKISKTLTPGIYFLQFSSAERQITIKLRKDTK